MDTVALAAIITGSFAIGGAAMKLLGDRMAANATVEAKRAEAAPAVLVAQTEAHAERSVADITGVQKAADRVWDRLEAVERRAAERDAECDRKLDAMAEEIKELRRERDDIRDELHNTVAELKRQRDDERRADRIMWEERVASARRGSDPP